SDARAPLSPPPRSRGGCQRWGGRPTTRPETMVNAAAFSAFTGVFNTTGHPAMSVPAGVDGNGLPVGVPFVARPGDEATLLRLAAALEVAAPWPTTPVVPNPG